MKVVFQSIHGSRLYGTEHAGSDFDQKIVFAHSLSELITGAEDCFRTYEPDTEHMSLKRFALLLGQQQTNAIEMLFTPKEFIVETSPVWEELRANKHRLVSKNITPFADYAKTQARVYSEKGNSLNMLRAIKDDMAYWAKYHSVTTDTTGEDYTDGKYASVGLPKICEQYPTLVTKGEKINSGGQSIAYYKILDKQFECLVPFNEWKSRIETMISRYGERAKKAAEGGAFDRKAMYNALRIIDEANELLTTGGLVFPRPEPVRSALRDIRFNEACTFEMAQTLLEVGYNLLIDNSMLNSTLQENIDMDYLDNWYKSTQMSYVKKELALR